MGSTALRLIQVCWNAVLERSSERQLYGLLLGALAKLHHLHGVCSHGMTIEWEL